MIEVRFKCRCFKDNGYIGLSKKWSGYKRDENSIFILFLSVFLTKVYSQFSCSDSIKPDIVIEQSVAMDWSFDYGAKSNQEKLLSGRRILWYE